MTLYINVTDAVSPASNHGISRVERKLAGALAADEDTQFFMLIDQRGWVVDKASAMTKFEPQQRSATPYVERYGIDAPPAKERPKLTATMSRALRAGVTRTPPVMASPLQAGPGDTLVSVGLDWVHGMPAAAENFVFGSGAKFLTFCHDLIPILHPEWVFPADPVGFRRHFERTLRVASKVLTYSDQTRGDFLRTFPDTTPDRVPKVVLGSDSAVSAGPEHLAFASELFDGEPYAIYCATIDRRKNHELLYRVARQFARRKIPGNVLFVGMMGNGTHDWVDAMRHDPLVKGRIAHLTNCDDQFLAACYQRASFAVYPSLYEGWGLGVTEALANGSRCLVASGSSLGEAGMGVCRELNPLNTMDWVNAMQEYFEVPEPAPVVELPTWEMTAADVRMQADSVTVGSR